MPDSYHRSVSWIAQGVEGEILGDASLADEGAAGLSVDCYDRQLGAPPHTKIIASSGGHTDAYVLNPEHVAYGYLGLTGSYDSRVRADIAYFTTGKKGAVFSCGSSAFAQALPVKNFDNDASRLLANVLNAFVKDGNLPGHLWISDEKQWR
jgi:N,N-dimethylformamidase